MRALAKATMWAVFAATMATTAAFAPPHKTYSFADSWQELRHSENIEDWRAMIPAPHKPRNKRRK